MHMYKTSPGLTTPCRIEYDVVAFASCLRCLGRGYPRCEWPTDLGLGMSNIASGTQQRAFPSSTSDLLLQNLRATQEKKYIVECRCSEWRPPGAQERFVRPCSRWSCSCMRSPVHLRSTAPMEPREATAHLVRPQPSSLRVDASAASLLESVLALGNGGVVHPVPAMKFLVKYCEPLPVGQSPLFYHL